MPPRARSAPDTGPTYALLYTRVSGAEQGREGVSLAQQLLECRRYAAERGWVLHAEFTDILSGTRDDRPQYRALLQAARDQRAAGQAVAVVALRLDRFGRHLREQLRCREEFQHIGVAVHFIRQGGVVPDLVANLLASVAQEEVRLLGERVSDAKAHVIAAGWYPGGPPPWGYQMRDATAAERAAGAPRRVLALDPATAPFVLEAAQRIVAGASVRSVQLWAAALPTAARGGRALGWSRLRGYLASELLRGRLHGRPAQWPALLDGPLAAALDGRLAQWERGLRQPNGHYLLTGLLHCPRCGHAMHGHRNLRAGRQAYYRCSEAVERPRCSYTVVVAGVEAAVMAAVAARLAPLTTASPAAQRALERQWQALRQPPAPAPVLAQQRAYERVQAQAQQRLRAAAVRLVDGDLDRTGYEPVRQQAEADLAAASTALRTLPAPTPTLLLPPWAVMRDQWQAWAEALAGADWQARRAVLLALCTRLTPYRAGRARARVEVEWSTLGAALGRLGG